MVQVEAVPLAEEMMVRMGEVTETAALEATRVMMGTGGQTGDRMAPEALVAGVAQVAEAAQVAARAAHQRRTSSCEHLGTKVMMSRPQ